jgi:GTP-binding protein
MRQKMFGKNAEDLTITLPFGTKITDLDTGKIIEITNEVTPVLIAKGGRGGRGNVAFKSATNQTPLEAEKGTKGEEKHLLLELRLIAEIGLIGLPNAGKSTLLSVITNAKPGIGAYPFTTLEPNLGMMGKHAIADIPGLIKGASDGKGLGTDFLRHIEKTKILIHCIDASTTSPKTTYDTIRNEFKKFNEALLSKPEFILLTKTDLVPPETTARLKKLFTEKGHTVFTYSVHNQSDIDRLKQTILALLESP